MNLTKRKGFHYKKKGGNRVTVDNIKDETKDRIVLDEDFKGRIMGSLVLTAFGGFFFLYAVSYLIARIPPAVGWRYFIHIVFGTLAALFYGALFFGGLYKLNVSESIIMDKKFQSVIIEKKFLIREFRSSKIIPFSDVKEIEVLSHTWSESPQDWNINLVIIPDESISIYLSGDKSGAELTAAKISKVTDKRIAYRISTYDGYIPECCRNYEAK